MTVKFGWDKLKRFKGQANTWTGAQTFSNIAVTGGSISGAVITDQFTTSTNPASSAAVTTAIVDAYNGVVITTNVNNAQTIAAPTAATVKTFKVINNDTSSSAITVNGITLAAGKGQTFTYDGSAWGPTDIGLTAIPVPVAEGGTGRATGTSAYALKATGTTATGIEQSLAVGATTEVLVGGGASALPVWTTATGSGAPARATSPALVTPTRTTTPADNDSSLAIPTTAGVKNELSVLANPKSTAQSVAMTAAASGSSGITVADNDNIDFGTGNFAPYFNGLVPDFTPAADLILMQKWTANVGYELGIKATTGYIYLKLNTTTYTSSAAPTAADGTKHHIAPVVTVGAVNTTVDFYFDAVALGTQQTAANPGTVSNAAALYILGTSAVRTAGAVSDSGTLNFAPTAAEVLAAYRNGGPLEEWKDGSQTAQTSGTLVVGKQYIIDDWITNDDFTNVGGANVDGTRFTATGTTPTTWTNSSSVRRAGPTLNLGPESWQADKPYDLSSNNLSVSYPATGWSLTRNLTKDLATNAESILGTSTTRRITPDDLKYVLDRRTLPYYGVTWDSTTDAYTRTGMTAGQATAVTVGNAFLPIQASMRGCILNDDGTVKYYLSATDWTKKEDGSTASDLTGADGQVMVEVPKFWYRYLYAGTTHTWEVSPVAMSGFAPHPAFFKDGAWVDNRYFGAYEGVLYDTSGAAYTDGSAAQVKDWTASTGDKLSSVSGKLAVSNGTRAQFRAIAANRGTGWRQQDYDLTAAIQLLMLTEYASFYTQSVIGAGITNVADWAAYNSYFPIAPSGLGNAIGNATGTNAAASNAAAATVAATGYLKYRGIENFYGHVWKFVDGININDNIPYRTNAGANFADDTTSNYTRMVDVNGANVTLHNANGWPATLQKMKQGFLPASVGADGATKLTDYYYQAAGWRVVIVGGHADYGAAAGAFFVYAYHDSGVAYSHVSGRVCF